MTQRPHPLDNLISDNSLFLLEAMVPFVEYPYKKPLILFIKYRELSAILQGLDDPKHLSECGFDCHPKNTEDMINSMCQFLPGNYGESIKQMKQMMTMMEMMNQAQGNLSQTNLSQTNPENSKSSEDLYSKVLSILNES